MDAFLIVVSGAQPKRLPLRLPTVIGRSVDAGLKVKAAAVSRNHCEIYEYEHELAVKDLGSSNGTFVNDERIEGSAFLSPGDELRVGGVTFRAEYELPPEQEAAASEPGEADAREEDVDESAEAASHIELRNTDEGSFIFIDDGGAHRAPADPADSKLGEFFQGLD